MAKIQELTPKSTRIAKKYLFRYNQHMKMVAVSFYRSRLSKQPVRDWLRTLPHEDRLILGQDLKTVEFGWPLGMPLVRKLRA